MRGVAAGAFVRCAGCSSQKILYAGNSDRAEKDFKKNPSTRGWTRDMIILMLMAQAWPECVTAF
jgi:hypothetical protein